MPEQPMIYGIIPCKGQAMLGRYEKFEHALTGVGLNPHDLDHGNIDGERAVVVGGRSLRGDPETSFYWSVEYVLYSGPAVFYGINTAGKTVSLSHLPAIAFYRDAYEVEKIIQYGYIQRPRLVLNSTVIWEWKFNPKQQRS